MDHCYSHSTENPPILIDPSVTAKQSTSLIHKDRPDHSYHNNRENLQYKDHSYFQFAKKTPPIHQFRVTLYKEECNRSTPLVSRDHTYVRALQLRQNTDHTTNAESILICKHCSAVIPTTLKPNSITGLLDKKENKRLVVADPSALQNICQDCIKSENLGEALLDHSYNQLNADIRRKGQLKPQKITSWSDHTYMTFR